MSTLAGIFENRWISLVARVFLALVFIFYSFDKLQDPRSFTKAVGAYQLVPSDFLNLFSIMLPGIEMAAGIALLLGLFMRGSAMLLIILLIIFMGAFATTSLLGVELFDCGCGGGENGEETVSALEFYIRDIILLIAAIIAYKGRHFMAMDNLIVYRKKDLNPVSA